MACPSLDTDTLTSSNLTSRAPVAFTAVCNSTRANDAMVSMWLSVSPILLVVGLVGNSLVLATMTRQTMSGTSTCVYLVAMATLDIGVIVFGLIPDWLAGATIACLTNVHPVMCELIRFLKYTFVDSSIWIRCLFNIDRCVAVKHPLYSGRYFGRVTSSRVYVVVALIASCVLNSHEFFMHGSCGAKTPTDKNFDFYIRPWIVLVFTCAVPFAIIAITNAIIIFSLTERRRGLLATMRRRAINNIVRVTTGKTVPDDPLRQVTLMCLAISGLFLLCTAPGIILLIGRVKWCLPNGVNVSYEISKNVVQIFFYAMFAGNFFLYCLTANKFRSTLRSVCCLGNPPAHLPCIRTQTSAVRSRSSVMSADNVSMVSSSVSSTMVLDVPCAA